MAGPVQQPVAGLSWAGSPGASGRDDCDHRAQLSGSPQCDKRGGVLKTAPEASCWVTFLERARVTMAGTTPKVWLVAWGGERQAEVQTCDASEGVIRLDTPAWDNWLSAPTTRRFAYPVYDGRVGYIRGWMTVRKERRSRG